jgi:hypothetical protein
MNASKLASVAFICGTIKCVIFDCTLDKSYLDDKKTYLGDCFVIEIRGDRF